MIRVVVAGDLAMVRGAVRRILERQPDIDVVAEAQSSADLLAVVLRDRPDVCVVDLPAGGPDGWATVHGLARVRPPAERPVVVVMSATAEDADVDRALRLGVRGFVTSDCGAGTLVHAVRSARDGHVLLAPEVTARLVDRLLPLLPQPVPDGSGSGGLTQREVAVLHGVVLGLSNREIAVRDGVAVSTVKTQIAALMRKFGVSGRVALAVRARASGIVPDGSAHEVGGGTPQPDP